MVVDIIVCVVSTRIYGGRLLGLVWIVGGDKGKVRPASAAICRTRARRLIGAAFPPGFESRHRRSHLVPDHHVRRSGVLQHHLQSSPSAFPLSMDFSQSCAVLLVLLMGLLMSLSCPSCLLLVLSVGPRTYRVLCAPIMFLRSASVQCTPVLYTSSAFLSSSCVSSFGSLVEFTHSWLVILARSARKRMPKEATL